MNTLVVPGYDDRYKTEEVHLKLRKMQKDYLVDLEDAAFAVKDEKGKVKLHQAVSLTAAGAISGGLWGSFIGLLFLNPLLGMAVGATSGAATGALTDVGINDRFMKELAATLKERCSALFVLVRRATPDKVLEASRTGDAKEHATTSRSVPAALALVLLAAVCVSAQTSPPADSESLSRDARSRS